MEKNGYNWPHFKNIHYEIASSKFPDEIFNSNVCISQKLDGSNLTIHIRKSPGKKWDFVELIGRNSVLWQISPKTLGTYEDDVTLTNLIYGNAKHLYNLPLHMFDYAVGIAKLLNTNINELYITGEALRVSSKQVSWHPFGYEIINDNTNIIGRKKNYLTSTTHKLFSSPSKSKDEAYNISPPPILFVGTLGCGITELYDIMKQNLPTFEGCFIVGETDNKIGFKWKTRNFEEQKKIKSSHEIAFSNEISIHLYNKLENIFNINIKNSINDQKDINAEKPRNDLKKDISIACVREISKMSSIANIPKKDRVQIVKDMVISVIAEIEQNYTESNIQIGEYEKQFMSKKC
jgi:hypothetical protein